MTLECVNVVWIFIYDSDRIKLKELPAELTMNCGSIQHIAHDEMGFHEV